VVDIDDELEAACGMISINGDVGMFKPWDICSDDGSESVGGLLTRSL